MKSIDITTIEELKSEITRLRVLDYEQQMALQLRFRSPSAIFATVMTAFPKKTGAVASSATSFLHPDILRLISRVVIPFTLNKTLFRHSNFLVKMLVSLVSQKAAGLVSESATEGLMTKFKSLFKSKSSKQIRKGKSREHSEELMVIQ